MTTSAWSVRAPLIIALVFSTALKLWLVFLVPVETAEVPGSLSSYNDELAHVHYVSHILTAGSLPPNVEPIDEPGALARANFENFQPPLYYALVAAVCKVSHGSRELQIARVGRLCNLLFSLLCVGVAWRLGRALGLSAFAQQGLGILTALNGCFLRFGSTMTNDMLLWLLTGFFFLVLLADANQRGTRPALILLVVLTAALYTKASAVILLFLFLVSSVFTGRTSGLLRTVLLSIGAVLLSLPVWLRNVKEFHDLLPLAAGFGTPAASLPGFSAVTFAFRSFFNPYQESWTGLSDLAYLLPLCACLLGVPVIWQKLSQHSRMLLAGAAALSVTAFFLLNTQYQQAEAKYVLVTWPVFLLPFASAPGQGRWRNWYVLAAGALPLVPLLGLLGES